MASGKVSSSGSPEGKAATPAEQAPGKAVEPATTGPKRTLKRVPTPVPRRFGCPEASSGEVTPAEEEAGEGDALGDGGRDESGSGPYPIQVSEQLLAKLSASRVRGTAAEKAQALPTASTMEISSSDTDGLFSFAKLQHGSAAPQGPKATYQMSPVPPKVRV